MKLRKRIDNLFEKIIEKSKYVQAAWCTGIIVVTLPIILGIVGLFFKIVSNLFGSPGVLIVLTVAFIYIIILAIIHEFESY